MDVKGFVREKRGWRRVGYLEFLDLERPWIAHVRFSSEGELWPTELNDLTEVNVHQAAERLAIPWEEVSQADLHTLGRAIAECNERQWQRQKRHSSSA